MDVGALREEGWVDYWYRVCTKCSPEYIRGFALVSLLTYIPSKEVIRAVLVQLIGWSTGIYKFDLENAKSSSIVRSGVQLVDILSLLERGLEVPNSYVSPGIDVISVVVFANIFKLNQPES